MSISYYFDKKLIMATDEKSPERRKQERRQLDTVAFAMLTPHVIGKILNISKKGLSFCYITGRDQLKATSNLNIELIDGGFGLHNIPIKTVWDSAMPCDFHDGIITTRLCAVKFGDLTDEQKNYLDLFIRTHTKDPSKSR
jgi:hypothetical protein